MTVPDPSLSGFTSFSNLGRLASRGNRLATLVSAFAFAFSGVSFYETVMKQPQLTAFVPPVINYARGDGGGKEIFAIPVTISNDGARTGTVLTLELTVTDPKSNRTKRYYSSAFGEPPKTNDIVSRAFAPLSIQGRATFTDTIQFLPIGASLPHTIQAAGDYSFQLALITPEPANPGWLDWLWRARVAPLAFERTLPYISEQALNFRRSAIAMHDKSWNPPAPPQPSDAAKAEHPPSGEPAAKP
jgi:hypothetical protein